MVGEGEDEGRGLVQWGTRKKSRVNGKKLEGRIGVEDEMMGWKEHGQTREGEPVCLFYNSSRLVPLSPRTPPSPEEVLRHPGPLCRHPFPHAAIV